MNRVENLRERIRESDDLADEQRDVLLSFSNELRLRSSEYGDYRHAKLLRHVTLLAERDDVPVEDVPEDRDACEEAVLAINRRFEAEETNRDYRVAVRQFARHLTDGDEVPGHADWISGSTSRNHNPKPNPGDMISHDECERMREAATNLRDAAMVSVAWDAGARSGEFRDVKLGDISEHENGLQITVDGKTGQRSITLIPSVPHLRQWLNDHPGRGDPDAPLWCKLKEPSSMSYRNFNDILKRLARRADVSKPVTLTNFRKSRASYLASQGMSQAHLEDRMGWVRGSSVASRYVSVFDEEADRELARIHGLEVEDESEDLAPLTCPRCDRETPRDRDLCVWCGQAMTQEGARKSDEAEEAVVEEAVQVDSGAAELAQALQDAMSDNPALKATVAEAMDD